MASLSETNKYLRDKKKREQMIKRNVVASSVFEGVSPETLDKNDQNPRSNADSKKSDKGS